jgi:hypothetical protein
VILRQTYAPSEVATMLGVSLSTVYRYVLEGKIPALPREEGDGERGHALRVPIEGFHKVYPDLRCPFQPSLPFPG